MARRRSGGSRPYARTERVNELVREIVAEELQAIDDERLELLTVTGVVVDPELRTGRVFYDGPDALDDAGAVTATHDMSAVTADQVAAAAAALVGDILQVPPMVSAVKVEGRRLHELARQGIEVERQPRPVTVHRFEVSPVAGQPGVWRAEVDCSSGTYVRVLAADLGAALGGGAHLRALRRTAIGSFGLDEAVAVEALSGDGLLPPAAALRDHPSVVVDEAVAADVAHGKVLPRDVVAIGVPDAAHAWAVLGPDGSLLAVYEPHRAGTAKPAVVVAPAAT